MKIDCPVMASVCPTSEQIGPELATPHVLVWKHIYSRRVQLEVHLPQHYRTHNQTQRPSSVSFTDIAVSSTKMRNTCI